jgi:hypothetical protein
MMDVGLVLVREDVVGSKTRAHDVAAQRAWWAAWPRP